MATAFETVWRVRDSFSLIEGVPGASQFPGRSLPPPEHSGHRLRLGFIIATLS